MAIIVGNHLNNNLFGTAFNDTIAGQGGNDLVAGFAGNDTLKGGLGNDVFDGGLGTDTADYSNAVLDPTGPAGPVTTIGAIAGVRVDLDLLGIQNTVGAGLDRLVSIENLIGTNFNDTFNGNLSNNVLNGLGGNDILNGRAGNDTLSGGLGNDLITGGGGKDTLTSGSVSDRDTFDYNAVRESSGLLGPVLRDVITDFRGQGASFLMGDRIDLRDIDANTTPLAIGNQAFTYIGSAAFTGAGQLLYADGVLCGNTDANLATVEIQIQLNGDPALFVSTLPAFASATDILL